MEQILTALSGIAIAFGYVSFIKGTMLGIVKPSRTSWTVWFFQDGLMAVSALVAGIGPAAIMPVVWFAGAVIMLGLCLTKGTRDPFTPMEKACLVLSGFGILLWAVTGSPLTALVASVTAACIGGIPTVVKAWKKPETESVSGWLLMFVATIVNSLAIPRWTFESGLLPISVGILQIAILLPLVAHGFRSRVK